MLHLSRLAELLGRAEGALAVGELNNTWRALAAGQRCSCMELPADCPVWGPALTHVSSAPCIAEMEALRGQIERQRRIPELLGLGRRSRRQWPEDVATYVEALSSVVEGLVGDGGQLTLIDSSKSVAGLCLASLATKGSVAAVHVRRDPRGVMFSEARRDHIADSLTKDPPPRRSSLRSVLDWNITNSEAAVVGPLIGAYTTVSYEEMCRHPSRSLAPVWRSVGIRPEAFPRAGATMSSRASHILAGNPTRTRHDVAIQLDEEWAVGLGAFEQGVVLAATLPGRVVMAAAAAALSPWSTSDRRRRRARPAE